MTEETAGFLPPQSLDAERSALGGILLDSEIALEAFARLEAEDFFDRKHRYIFQAARDLDSRNEVIDLVTVSEELTRRKWMEQAGGVDYIASLTDCIPVLSNVAQYISIIRDKSLLRQLLVASQENIRNVYDGTGRAQDILDAAERNIFTIGESLSSKDFIPISELVGSGMEALEQLRDARGFVTGLSTGFDELDRMTTGFHSGELVILAARPSVGKTSLALNMAEHMSRLEKGGVAFFSLEMSAEQLTQRLLCANAGIGTKPIIEGTLAPSHWKELTDSADRLSKLPIFIDDTAGIGSMELRAKVRHLGKREKLAIVFVDYLQLMRGEKGIENRQQEITRISGDLKALAKEMRIPVVALSQLSRQATKHEGPPRLSDLRESGAIEQDADVVLFLHDSQSDSGEEGSFGMSGYFRDVLLKIGKQRNGPRGEIDLVFDTAITRFFPKQPGQYENDDR
jgi:replicative DNA helicase